MAEGFRVNADVRLVTLLQICDSLFPIGAFAHSDGLEAATTSGQVRTVRDLGEWIDVTLDQGIVRLDGPAVLLARDACVHSRWDDLDALDARLYALRPSSTARAALRTMGTRLLKTWLLIHAETGYAGPREEILRTRPAYVLPVAFGIVSALGEIGLRPALEGFIYTRLASAVSAAMRLMPVGQTEAHSLLARTLARVPAAVDAIERSVEGGQAIGAFAPAMDLAAMEQRWVRSRLFLS
jgi:urease accessory protein